VHLAKPYGIGTAFYSSVPKKNSSTSILLFLAKRLIHQTMDLARRSMKSMALLKEALKTPIS
jgi:hypothetical protein